MQNRAPIKMQEDPIMKPNEVKLEPQILLNENDETCTYLAGSSLDGEQHILPEIISVISLANCTEFTQERGSIKVEVNLDGVNVTSPKIEQMVEDEDRLADSPTIIPSAFFEDCDAFIQEQISVKIEDDSTKDSDITEIDSSDSMQFVFANCSVKIENENATEKKPLSTHTNNEPCCEFCSTKFKSHLSLRNHYKQCESNKKPYACEHCSAKFRLVPELKAHLPVHFKDNPFHCTHCGMTFKYSSSLKKHLLTHSNVKFSSEYCSREFRSSPNFNDHIRRSHRNEEPFSCNHCLATFKNITKLKVHLSTHFKDNPFSCDRCSASFKVFSSLEKHVSTAHSNEKLLSCAQCSAKFTSKKSLKIHILSHCKKKRFTCKLCSVTFMSRRSYKKHKAATDAEGFTSVCTNGIMKRQKNTLLSGRSKAVSTKKYLLKDLCSVELSTISTVPESAALDSDNPQYIPSTTDKNEIVTDLDDCFEEKSVNSENPVKTSSKDSFSCEQCAMQFKKESSDAFTQEQISVKIEDDSTKDSDITEIDSSDSMQFVFANCSVKIENENATEKKPLSTHTNNEPCCEFCSTKFKSHLSLRNHYKQCESNKKPYACEHCSAKFRLVPELKAHLPVHFKDNPFHCTHCGVTFKYSSSLKKHLLTHSNVKFSCEYCSREFRSSPNFNDHIRQNHRNEEPFSCNLCLGTFKNITKLKVHLSTHFKDNPFSCNRCSASFKVFSSLEKHVSTAHSNEKLLSCAQCSAKFTSQKSLKIHTLSHCKKKRFTCKLCSVTFMSRRSYKKHKAAADAEGFTSVCTNGIIKRQKNTLLSSRTKAVSNKKYLLSDLCSVELSTISTVPESAALDSDNLQYIPSTTDKNEIVTDSDDCFEEKSVNSENIQ